MKLSSLLRIILEILSKFSFVVTSKTSISAFYVAFRKERPMKRSYFLQKKIIKSKLGASWDALCVVVRSLRDRRSYRTHFTWWYSRKKADKIPLKNVLRAIKQARWW